MELAIIYPGQSVLSFFASRSFFLIGELLLGNLSKTVVVVGNTPHNRPCGLVGHLIGNRASFLCTKAPMLRIEHFGDHQPAAEKAPASEDWGKSAERSETSVQPPPLRSALGPNAS